MKSNLNIKTQLFLSFAIIAALISIPACDSDKKTEDTKEIAKDQNKALFGNTKKEKDALFIVKAADMNLMGIQLGQLAQQMSKSDDIKKFGKMLEEDHRKSLDQLIILADKKSIVVPKSLTDDALEVNNKLLNTLAADFDLEYSITMVAEHRDAISVFDKAATESIDLEIKKWAASTIPVLQSHLDYAIICQTKYEIK